MKTSVWRALAVALSLAAAAAPPAAAHRVGEAITTIAENPRTGAWEIVHELSAHDLETALIDLGAPADVFQQPDALALIQAYVERRFRLIDQEGAPIRPTYVGAEIDQGLVYVYFELDAFHAAAIDDDLLLETSDPRARAVVHIRRNDDVRTLVFAAGSPKQPVD